MPKELILIYPWYTVSLLEPYRSEVYFDYLNKKHVIVITEFPEETDRAYINFVVFA